MAQVSDSGYTVQPFRDSSGCPLPLRWTGAVVVLLLAASWAQAQGTPTNNSIGKNKPSPAVSPATVQEVDLPPDVPPPASTTAEQRPPQAPTVAWDGKQLTIDADNATLAAVLIAVRERTGASIEIPGAASGERVFLHLGPGPARDIISSLLYGTSFDYIVEAADDDPDTLRKVVLTARGLGDSSSDAVVAGATNPGEGSGGGDAGSTLAADAPRSRATEPLAHPERARMMPGWSSSGKPTSQAEAEAAWAAQQAAKEQESAVAQDPAASQESAAAAGAKESDPNAPNPGAVPTESQVANSNSLSSSLTTASPASSLTESDLPPTTDGASSSSSSSASNANDQSGAGAMIQNMTKMFEQRRQLQAQQNQTAQQPSSN